VAEGAPLLRVYRGNSIEGSNPSISAIFRNGRVAQLDRVLGYEPSGRRFESSRVRHPKEEALVVVRCKVYGRVAQLDRVLGYEPSGRRFESSRVRHIRKKPAKVNTEAGFLFSAR
jgi:hypothetical protein